MVSSIVWCICLVLTSKMAVTYATSITSVSVDTNCPSYEIHHVNEHELYEIDWNSNRLPGYGCKYGFIGQGDDVLDRYQVCVEAIDYDMEDCNVKLNYYFGFSIYPDKSYTCSSNPVKVCARENTYFDVEIKSTSIYTTTTRSSLKLKVTATKTYEYTSIVGAVVGGVLGGIALITISTIVIIVIVCNRSRHNTRGHVYNTGVPTNATYNQPAPTVVTLPTAPQPSSQPPPYAQAQQFTYNNNGQQNQGFTY